MGTACEAQKCTHWGGACQIAPAGRCATPYAPWFRILEPRYKKLIIYSRCARTRARHGKYPKIAPSAGAADFFRRGAVRIFRSVRAKQLVNLADFIWHSFGANNPRSRAERTNAVHLTRLRLLLLFFGSSALQKSALPPAWCVMPSAEPRRTPAKRCEGSGRGQAKKPMRDIE